MNVFTFVTIIVVAGILGEVIKTWIKQRDRHGAAQGELKETLAKVDHLEERIRVLERIVTENRVDLKQQIDSL